MRGSSIDSKREDAFADLGESSDHTSERRPMIDKEKENELIESASRRTFLGASSAALATAALVGLTASAQQREDTRKAESDHSSSDPGQENTPLLAENPNTNTPPPTDHGDIGPIWYSFDLARKRVEEGGWTHQV